jgi:putative aldouronate transport system substrate-binding protein
LGKIITCTIAVSLLTVSILAGCKETSKLKEDQLREGQIQQRDKLTVIKPLYPGHIFHPDSELEKLVEAGADVDLTYETPPYSEYRTRLAVTMSGGDIPDIVNTYSPNDPEHNTLIDQGVFMALDELLLEFPRLRKSFSEETWNYMRNPTDGKIYGVPWMRDRGGQGIMIRRDWLDRLGLKPPKTLDELTEVLIAFRDQDPDGNGLKDTTPLTFKDHQIGNLASVFTLFGINSGWHPSPDDSGQLQYGWIQPEAKEAVQLLRSYRQQGLLDPDLFVGKTLGIDKFLSGKVGVMVTILGDFRQLAVQTAMKAEILDPIVHNGNYWSLNLPSTPISRTNQIYSKSKNPRAALRYLEYQVTEGFDHIQYGVEGKTYRVENGVNIPFDHEQKDPQYATNVGLELLQPEWLFNDPEKYTKFVSKTAAEYMIQKLDTYEQHVMYDYQRPNIVFPIQQEKWTLLRSILEEGYMTLLLDTKKNVNEVFDEMVIKWRASGGDQVVEEINRLQKDKSMPSYTYMRK